MFYEAAVSEPNPKLRLQRLAEAQKLVLARAHQLENEGGTDVECQALEDAAEFLRQLKAESTGDGIGSHLEPENVNRVRESEDPDRETPSRSA
jgi:hypothetical protein